MSCEPGNQYMKLVYFSGPYLTYLLTTVHKYGQNVQPYLLTHCKLLWMRAQSKCLNCKLQLVR